MVQRAPPRTQTAVGEEAGEVGAAARCCYRADGDVVLAAMLGAGTGVAGIVGVVAPSAPVPFAVLALWRRGAVSADADDEEEDGEEEELERESGYSGGEGELAEAGWSAKGVSSDACVGTIAVNGSGLMGSGSVRSSQHTATFSVDAMARAGRCGREVGGWVEEMVAGQLGCGAGDRWRRGR